MVSTLVETSKIMNFKCSNFSFLTYILTSLLTAAEKSCNEEGNSSYDPRVRPWYVAASSGPKDIILVLDISGSMDIEQRIDKLKLAASRVISTLGIGDYFAVVSFSDDAIQLGTEDLLLSRATDDNKNAMLRYIDALEPGGGTIYYSGFDKAFDIFEKSNSVEVSTSCRQAILFVTDGAMSDPEQALYNKIDQERKKYTSNDKKPPVIFTYSFGDSAPEEVPQNLACRYDGVWSRISDEENLTDSMGGYYKYFSYGLGDIRNDDFVAWVSPYVYANGGSLGTTASAPVYDRSPEHPVLIGVVGFDFTLAAMERALGKEGSESRDIIIEDILEKSIAKCPIFNLTDCQMESLRMYGTDPTGFPAATCETCPSGIPSLESVACTTEDLSSVSLWANDNVRNWSFEERACCNVGESRAAGTVTLSEVREQVCEEGSSDEPSVLPSDEPLILSPSPTRALPSDEPSVFPSDEPSVLPSDEPSVLPSDEPLIMPPKLTKDGKGLKTKSTKSRKDGKGLKAKSRKDGKGLKAKSTKSRKDGKVLKAKSTKSRKNGKGLKAKSMKSRKSRNVISIKNNEKGVKAKEGSSGGGTFVEFVVLEEGINLE